MTGEKKRGPSVTRGRLLDAAGLFGLRPFSEVSVAQLVHAAYVQPPTLYHFFGDKEGLFVAWAVSAIEKLGHDLRHGLKPPADFQDALVHVAGCLSSTDYPDILRLQRDAAALDRSESREQIIEALHRAVFEPLYAIFLVGMERKLLRTEPVRRTASVFVAVSVAHRPGGELHEADDQTDLKWWVDRFLRGFGAEA